jgi:hypothetical protein
VESRGQNRRRTERTSIFSQLFACRRSLLERSVLRKAFVSSVADRDEEQ